jgi:hypothetical protein
MPRGSKPGERRGGRGPTTPNRRTVLAGVILSVASEHPSTPYEELLSRLVTDSRLPGSLRLAVARKWNPDLRLRSVKRGAGKRTTATRETVSAFPDVTGPTKPARQTGTTDADAAVDSALFPVLFGILQDSTANRKEMRDAAKKIALYFLPKQSKATTTRANAPSPDECGFAVDPELAKELRDLKLELACLPGTSRKRSPYLVAQKSRKMQERIRAIQESLECPCPTTYRLTRHLPDAEGGEIVQEGEIQQDKVRLESFRLRRAKKQVLTLEEDLEEAIRGARYDSHLLGDERVARKELAELQEKERAKRLGFGPALSREQKATLRALTLLYPQHHKPATPELRNHPFLSLPIEKNPSLAARGQPALSAAAAGNDLEEFAPCPPYCAVDQEVSAKKGRTVLKYWFENPSSLD